MPLPDSTPVANPLGGQQNLARPKTSSSAATLTLKNLILSNALTDTQSLSLLYTRRAHFERYLCPHLTESQREQGLRIFDDAIEYGVPEAKNEGKGLVGVVRKVFADLGQVFWDVRINWEGSEREESFEEEDAEIEAMRHVYDIWKNVQKNLGRIDPVQRSYVLMTLAPELRVQVISSYATKPTGQPLQQSQAQTNKKSLIVSLPLRVPESYFMSPAFRDIRESFYHVYHTVIKDPGHPMHTLSYDFINKEDEDGYNFGQGSTQHTPSRTQKQKGKGKELKKSSPKANTKNTQKTTSSISSKKAKEAATSSRYGKVAEKSPEKTTTDTTPESMTSSPSSSPFKKRKLIGSSPRPPRTSQIPAAEVSADVEMSISSKNDDGDDDDDDAWATASECDSDT
ncbi:unnamed protein product [Periconia digitata]|uniref:Uncharacterized protein n=1 Tax=Periconia digitata TaxID=1303443 RepID=A0A9W4UC30_9PLEO|nr:unnamed protein product [Periconia digitata]